MANNPTNGANKPFLAVKEISDIYLRKNFQSLFDYFQSENQLLGFRFFEVVFAAAEKNRKIAHGLGYVPADVVISKIVGTGGVQINYGLFDSSNIDLTATGPATVRFYVGKYWNSTVTQGSTTDFMLVQSSAAVSAANLAATFLPPPDIQTFTTIGTTWIRKYAFQITSTIISTGTVYAAPDGIQYTITNGSASATTTMYATGPSLTTVTSGTLTKVSGTGPSTIAFTAAKAPLYLIGELVGGGGGGGAPAVTSGSVGGDSYFGPTSSPLVYCQGGIEGRVNDSYFNVIRLLTVAAPAVALNKVPGIAGGGCTVAAGAKGGDGAPSYYGGAGNSGGGTNVNQPGSNAINGTGSGGGGGSTPAAGNFMGIGGGSGSFCKFMIPTPANSYALTIGGGGAGASGSLTVGGRGADGSATVIAYYQ